jgi:hypothetical protein
MNAAFCCASLGIVPTVRHADYIGSWIDVCAKTIALSSARRHRRARRPTMFSDPCRRTDLPKLATSLRSSEAWHDPSLSCVRTWPLMISPADHTPLSKFFRSVPRVAGDGVAIRLISCRPPEVRLRSPSRSVIREKRLHRRHHACRRHLAIQDVKLDDRIHDAPTWLMLLATRPRAQSVRHFLESLECQVCLAKRPHRSFSTQSICSISRLLADDCPLSIRPYPQLRRQQFSYSFRRAHVASPAREIVSLPPVGS